MSQTVAEAAAAYRKRRAGKIARYEAALEIIASREEGFTAVDAAIIARNALNPETNDG